MGEEGDGAEKKRKKLLILDVNGVLVDTYWQMDERPFRVHDAKLGKLLVYNRPHCEEFLKFCLQHFHVAIWSSAKEHNVARMVNYILGESKDLLAFVWSQSHCTDSGLKCPDNIYKPLFLKELQRVWKSSKPVVPWEQGEYGTWNTLLIDDSPHKVLRNPDHTAVLALPFSAMESSAPDDFLPILQTYLTKLIEVPDVQEFVRNNPIGQSWLTESTSDWDFYSKLKYPERESKIKLVRDKAVVEAVVDEEPKPPLARSRRNKTKTSRIDDGDDYSDRSERNRSRQQIGNDQEQADESRKYETDRYQREKYVPQEYSTNAGIFRDHPQQAMNYSNSQIDRWRQYEQYYWQYWQNVPAYHYYGYARNPNPARNSERSNAMTAEDYRRAHDGERHNDDGRRNKRHRKF